MGEGGWEEGGAPRRAPGLDASAELREGKKGLRKITSAATMHRLNDTLSSALSWGVKREHLFPRNWAQLVELPPVTRPKPLVWTSEHIEHWKRTGEKPGPIMVWTPEQSGQFLDLVKDDWLYELWLSFIFLGPAAPRWPCDPGLKSVSMPCDSESPSRSSRWRTSCTEKRRRPTAFAPCP